MNQGFIIITCPHCGTKNRVPEGRRHEAARCGKCHTLLPLDMASPIELTDANFSREALSFPGPILVDFDSPRCGYCRMLAPVIDEIAAEYAGRVRVGKINVDANPATAARYNVRGTPTLILLRHGSVVKTLVGVMDIRELERALDSIL